MLEKVFSQVNLSWGGESLRRSNSVQRFEQYCGEQQVDIWTNFFTVRVVSLWNRLPAGTYLEVS